MPRLMREAVGREGACSTRPATSASPTITARRSTRSPSASRLPLPGRRCLGADDFARGVARRFRRGLVLLLRALRLPARNPPERDILARAGLRGARRRDDVPGTGAAEYLRRLVRLCEVLLDFEMQFEDKAGGPASAFLMRRDNRDAAYFDCQSAALLALTRAAAIVEDPLSRPRSNAGWRLRPSSPAPSSCRSRTRSTPSRSNCRAAATAGQHQTAFWNFKAGLALRFFAALRRRRCRRCRRSPPGTPTASRCSRRSCDSSSRNR